MTFIILMIFIISSTCEIEENFIELSSYVDETLQQFQSDVNQLKSGSIKLFNEKFRDFISRYEKNFHSHFYKFSQIIGTWKENCFDLPNIKIDSSIERKLWLMCDDFRYFSSKISNVPSVNLSNLYNDELETNTFAELYTEDFFVDMSQKLELLTPIYHMNMTCVKPLMNEFLQIISDKFTTKIAKLFEGLNVLTSSKFRFVQTTFIRSIKSFEKIKMKVKECKNSTTPTKCFEPMMFMCRYTIFRELTTRCEFYHSIKFAYKNLYIHEYIHSVYINQIEKIYDIVRDINVPILNWQNKLEACIPE